ncbi:hypothetical protein H4Q32_012732 [Labeo rohita]|uniref:Uncharacterized protein n=1 Tax=Labeo rohita TaxID=84645 RepID=A0ABQ8LZ64_LABRO|nr:hypothetical protein H4Q32_012732 [Labeo rohita]
MATETSSLKTRSHASCSSARSSTSSTGSAAVKARVRAEAAKARFAFAEEEVNLKLQKAKVEASMEMLKHKKEAAAAVAEAEALEAAIDENAEKHSCKLSLNSAPLETTQRTEQYVIDQTKARETELQMRDVPPKTELSPSYSISASHLKPEAKPFLSCQTSVAFQPPDHTFKQSGNRDNEYARKSCEVGFRNIHSTPLQHLRTQNNTSHLTPLSYPISPNSHNDNSNINDFVRYLARRELVATGLLQFNDKPQNYRVWKRSFQNATADLNLIPSEEIDLLLKWLGKESAEHVEQIRAIHINHSQAGLDMAWDRLDQTYGSIEVIEDALFKRIDAFPKIPNRDYSKLTKLSDLLMELQAAKAEGDLPGLAFLDTARGVNPIVQKLPFRLQERWASVDFVSQEASIGNDPSFNFVSHIDMSAKMEKTAWKSSKQREISVHKTAVSSRVSTDAGEPSNKSDDCNKLCTIHRKPHPLNKCRAFREKPIDARKAF